MALGYTSVFVTAVNHDLFLLLIKGYNENDWYQGLLLLMKTLIS